MQHALQLCLFAGTLALCLLKPAAAPVAGVWEGGRNGLKAMTLTVKETDGILGGAAVFYRVGDNPSGGRDGPPSPALPLVGTAWDGRTLRFSVDVPGASRTAFEMTLTRGHRAELKRVYANGGGEIVAVARRQER